MEDKNKVEDVAPEKKAEEAKEKERELADEVLEDVSGGTTPIIDAF